MPTQSIVVGLLVANPLRYLSSIYLNTVGMPPKSSLVKCHPSCSGIPLLNISPTLLHQQTNGLCMTISSSKLEEGRGEGRGGGERGGEKERLPA